MANSNKKVDYYDYLAGEINKIQEYNEQIAERVDEIMYGDKVLRNRKMKIKRIKNKINEHLAN